MLRRIFSALAGRCICGLRLRLHRDKENRSLACEQAAERHRYAKVRHRRLRELMLASIDGAKR